jgi:hypothetical protein
MTQQSIRVVEPQAPAVEGRPETSATTGAEEPVAAQRDVTVDTGYVQSMDFLAPGSRDRFDANNKAVDYLFRALCQPEFDRVHTEHLACRI